MCSPKRWRLAGGAALVVALAAVTVLVALVQSDGPSSKEDLSAGGGRPPTQLAARPLQRGKKLPRITAKGHDLLAGGQRFEVWGFNYGIGDRYRILDYFERPTAPSQRRVFQEMREARALGANTLRIYLEIGSFMRNPREPRPRALRAYREVVAKARRLGIYLDVTGNIAWRGAPRWYDALGEQQRWNVQARFWRAVAGTSPDSRAVLLYELTSEPNVTDSGSWYDGELGGKNWIHNIVRRVGDRDPQRLARQWTRKMRKAVRSRDRRHLISIGFMPFCGGPFAHAGLLDLIDLLVVHSHPREEEEAKHIKAIRDFSAHGIPVVLGETSPMLTRSWPEFLEEVRPYLDGYLYYYDGRRPSEFDKTSYNDLFLRTALKQFLALRKSLVGSRDQSDGADRTEQAQASGGRLGQGDRERSPSCAPFSALAEP